MTPITMTRSLAAAAVAVLFTIAPAAAQTSPYINVSVQHNGEDIVGTRVAYEVREQLRASSRYDLSDDATAKIGIYLSTLDGATSLPAEWPRGLSTVLSVTFAARTASGDYYLGSFVQIVGSYRVPEQASAILAKLDQSIEYWRQAYYGGAR